MYVEETRRINWLNVLKKGLITLLIILVIFLIVWLFTRNTYRKTNVNLDNKNDQIIDNNNKNNNNNINTPTDPSILDFESYSEYFITNYMHLHNSGKEYLTTNDLPLDGHSKKYSIRELINAGIMLPTKYKDSTCDYDSSYIMITNNNGKYSITTYLICGQEIAKTIEEIKCNKVCQSENQCKIIVEKSDLEYQFKKPYTITENVYSCPNGYTLSGKKCYKGSNKINATRHDSYSCPNGYTLMNAGENSYCIKNSSISTPAKENVQYYCTEGTLNDKKCIITAGSTTDATKVVNYSCPSGYTKSGSGDDTKCSKTNTTTITATKEVTYYCPSGYTASGSGANMKCTKTISTKAVATPTTTYSCPSGYTKSSDGKNCYRTETINAQSKIVSYNCPSGYTKSSDGKSCYKTNTRNAETRITGYRCSKGTLNGSKCDVYTSYYVEYSKSELPIPYKTYKGCTYSGTVAAICSNGVCTKEKYKYYCTKTSQIDATPIYDYYCPSGYTSSGSGVNMKCTKTETVPGTPVYDYYCPSGYTASGSGANKKCTKTISTPAKSKTTYSCSKGTLVGNECVYTETVSSNPSSKVTYKCPVGNLTNNTCVISKVEYTTPNKNTYYSCSNGILKDKKCYYTSSKTIDAKYKISYTCENGTLNGSKCVLNNSTKIASVKNTTYSCPSGYTKQDNTCISGKSSTIDATLSIKTITKYTYTWSTEEYLEGWTRTGIVRQNNKIRQEIPVK